MRPCPGGLWAGSSVSVMRGLEEGRFGGTLTVCGWTALGTPTEPLSWLEHSVLPLQSGGWFLCHRRSWLLGRPSSTVASTGTIPTVGQWVLGSSVAPPSSQQRHVPGSVCQLRSQSSGSLSRPLIFLSQPRLRGGSDNKPPAVPGLPHGDWQQDWWQIDGCVHS